MKNKSLVVLALLFAVLLGSCGQKGNQTFETNSAEEPKQSETTTKAEDKTSDTRVTEVTTDAKEEKPIPMIDIENSNAKNKYFVGVTDKDAVSYAIGEDICFTVQLLADKEAAFCPKFKYILTADDGRVPEEGMVDGKAGTISVKTKMTVPGFVYLRVYACDQNGTAINGVDSFNGGAGADVLNIRKIKEEPADFDVFWEKQLKTLEGVSPDLLEAREVDSPNPNFTVYAVKIRFCESNTWGDYVSGYLSLPKNSAPGSLSLHLYYNGAGVTELTKYCNDGLATLNVAAHSMELGQDRSYYVELSQGKLKDYAFNPQYNSSAETVYFREMLLRDVQAMRFMKRYFGSDGPDSRFRGLWDDVLKKQITLSGGSQGGFQCAAVSVLEPGVSWMNIYAPWLCDIGGYGVNGRQESVYMPAWTEAMEYYDSINFAKRIPCATYIRTVGLGDYTANPAGVTAFFNNMNPKVNREISYVQNRTHSYNPIDADQYVLKGKVNKS